MLEVFQAVATMPVERDRLYKVDRYRGGSRGLRRGGTHTVGFNQSIIIITPEGMY